MASLYKYFHLSSLKAFSRFLHMRIFGTIWNGELKGYKFMVDTDNTYFSGEYEKESFSYVLSEIKNKPGSVIFDLGANLGYFSLLCSRVADKNSRIFAFEPIPANLSVLCRHLLLNHVTNVIPVSLAASDRFGLVDFSADNDSVSYTYQKESDYYGTKKLNIKVAKIGLDNLINDFNFPVPDILKIDVEGAEYDVLRGSVELLGTNKPSILLSTHEAHIKGIEEKCLKFMKEHNYSCKKLPNDPGRFSGLNDYWCTPLKKTNDR